MKSVLIIGAAIADISGTPDKRLIYGDSNPGRTEISDGGVARNIAENLVRLGVDVQLITALGNDFFGKKIADQCSKLNINIKNCLYSEVENTATYLAISDHEGNLSLSISDTSIIDQINPEFLQSKYEVISGYDALVLDTNLSIESLDFILSEFNSGKIFIDTVSTFKAARIKDKLKNVCSIKTNLAEAGVLAHIDHANIKDLDYIRDFFLQQNVNQGFITLGKAGCYFFDQKEHGMISGADVKPVNTSGAGDAFMAGVVYGSLNNFDIKTTAKFSMAASLVALSHKSAVNPDITADLIRLTKKNNFENAQ